MHPAKSMKSRKEIKTSMAERAHTFLSGKNKK
jgi:hypothetical protein